MPADAAPIAPSAAPGRDAPGLVSALLEREVREAVRRHGIVVWPDREGAYTRLVDGLQAQARAGTFPAPVVPVRGSFAAWLLALDGLGDALEPTPLLVHLPGVSAQSLPETPALELFEIGHCFQPALETKVREAGRPLATHEELDAFLAQRGVTLESADAWLAERALALKGGLEARLLDATPLEVLGTLVARQGSFWALASSDAAVEALRSWWRRQLGLRFAWPWAEEAPTPGTIEAARGAIADAVVKWALTVEYVHDLKRPPRMEILLPLRKLGSPVVESCRALAAWLREHHADRYATLADELGEALQGELTGSRPEDLGDIDTFRFEEARVLEGALEALREGRWGAATTFAEARPQDRSFWLARDPRRRVAWSLVQSAAELGGLLDARTRPLEGVTTLEDATERYAAQGAPIDRAHRRLEQRVTDLLEPALPHFAELQAVVHDLRLRHRAWADRLARDFTAVCRDRGFLPEARLQQRGIYDDVVAPLVREGEKVALFMLDAFRYEMAEELAQELRAEGGMQVGLSPRLAELPSVTAVGMNALAPVAAGGRLTLAGGAAGDFGGFRHGEFVVRAPADRARAMGTKSLGKAPVLLTLAEVTARDAAALKRDVGRSPLVVVHGKEIDDAGEAGVGLKTFEATLREIRAAWHHLQQAGATRAVFTADHGFLLVDATAKLVRYGKAGDAERRYVRAQEGRAEAGLVPVSLAKLGYEGAGADGFLLLREDTALFETGRGLPSFVHGGNSPQERVVPVLTVVRARKAAPATTTYRVEAEPLPDEQGFRAVQVRIRPERQPQGTLGYVTPATIDLGLRAFGQPDVRAVVKDAASRTVRGGRIALPVGDAWTRVLFTLEGADDGRARVEVFHPDEVERVEPAAPTSWFLVEGRDGGPKAPVAAGKAPPGAGRAPAPPATPSTPETAPARPARAAEPEPEAWAANLEPGAARVFRHIHRHGAITEDEVVELLGSPRALRRFSLEFEALAQSVPFVVRIEFAASGKRYVREVGG